MRRCFFYHTDLGQKGYKMYKNYKTIILHFFTILQDKLHSFNQSRTIEARVSFAQQIIELISEFRIMQRVFSQKNMLLCLV